MVCVLGEEEDGGVCLENKMNGVGLKIEKREKVPLNKFG